MFPEIGEKVLLLNARRVIQRVHGQQLVLLAIEDITEHRKAQTIIAEREAWMRDMLDNAPVMIWVSDNKQSRHFFNRTWVEFVGQSVAPESNEGWMKQIHPDDLGKYLSKVSTSYEEKDAFKSEYRLRRHDGEYRWVLEVAKPTYSSNNEFTGFLASCTDIHDKKMMNEELEERV